MPSPLSLVIVFTSTTTAQLEAFCQQIYASFICLLHHYQSTLSLIPTIDSQTTPTISTL